MKDGLDMTALREVKFLQELRHPNVIAVRWRLAFRSSLMRQLLDVFSIKQNINLVLEFLNTDLEAVIRDRTLIFQNADTKSWLAMGLRGLEYIHRHGVLHRVSRRVGRCKSDNQDLKPNNFLIAADGQLKIADFGLAREFGDPGDRMTAQVITRCVYMRV